MQELIERLMNHPYWALMRLERGGNTRIARSVQAPKQLKQSLLSLVMHGFYPLSAAVAVGWQRIVEVAPDEEVRATARFFVEVEAGAHARAEWFRDVPHIELYHRMFNSLADEPLPLDEARAYGYLHALDLPGGGLERSLVAAAFIEKTGLRVLHLLHDFVLQWQALHAIPTSKVDLTYLNEHLLLERSDSADQHVPLVDGLLARLPHVQLAQETERFERLTSAYWSDIVANVDDLLTETAPRQRLDSTRSSGTAAEFP